MDKIGNIEIRVLGKSGNLTLKPDNYDIRHIASILQNVEDFLFPNRKKDRPLITYDIQEGSVKHVFKTSMQYVIAFNAILSQIQASQSLDFLDLKTARAFESFQDLAVQKDYEFQLRTSVQEDVELSISPKTKFYRTENVWVDAEFYFFGMLTNAGGKNKANIHLDTEEYGLVTIDTGKDFLKGQEENLLYKELGVRAIGKQNLETAEIDTKSLKLLDLIDYHPRYDAEYLDALIAKATKSWEGIDPDDWLANLRGEYEG